jgi:hypothetical protein
VRHQLPASSVYALIASLTLALGATLSRHLLFILGLPLTVAGFVVACFAVGSSGSDQRRHWLRRACACLSAMAALGIIGPSTHGALWYEILRRTYSFVGLVLVGVFASGDERWQRRSIRLAIAGGVALYALTPIGTPTPQIDVFAWTETSVKALAHGIHPYVVSAPDVYGGRYDPGYTVTVYPYMPATLLAYLPWVLIFDDFRYALAACLPITIALIRRTVRNLAVDAPEKTVLPLFGDVVTLALLLHPDGARVVASGWSEPLLVLSAAAFAYLATRNPGGRGQAVAFFLLPSFKQYVMAPVLMYVASAARHARLRHALFGASVAAVTVLPFLIWNWQATFAGIVFQMQAPTVPRLGSTSLVALTGTTLGIYPSRWTSVMVQLTAGGVAWWHLKNRSTYGLLLASALSLYATFLTGWQAFVNYYYFVGALLAFAAVLGTRAEVAA